MVDRKKTPDLLASVLSEPVLLGEDEVYAEIRVEAKADPPKKLKAAKAKQKPGRKTKAKTPSPVPAPPVPAPPVAETPVWEYMEVTFREYDGWRPRLVNGVELRGWKSQPVIHEYLNRMGAQGWEMVGLGEGRHSQRQAYFKRPVPQES